MRVKRVPIHAKRNTYILYIYIILHIHIATAVTVSAEAPSDMCHYSKTLLIG